MACALSASTWAQDLATPAVDDAPSAALLLEQALDQAPSNPREAVRLLRTVLDDWGTRLVVSPRDTDLFVSAARRVESALFADPALLAAFRREEERDARALLDAGQLDRVVATRLATEAGLEAALRVAQSALSHARFATAASVLARTANHDRLLGAQRLHHAAMQTTALARLGDLQGARAALERAIAVAAAPDAPADSAKVLAAARAELTRAASASAPATAPASLTSGATAAGNSPAWSEIWRVALNGPSELVPMDLTLPMGNRPPETRISHSMAVPAVDAERVYADDGSGLRAFDRLSGRPVWSHEGDASGTLRASTPTMHYTAVVGDAVINYVVQSGPGARSDSGVVVCSDAATGLVRWEHGLDFSDGRGQLSGVVPVGEPLIVDGRVVVAARRSTARLETVSWLFCFDVAQPTPPAWSSVVITAGSMMQNGVQGIESPVFAGGGLYLATGTGAVGRFDPSSGAAVWLRRFPVPVRDTRPRAEQWDLVTPAVGAGRVLAVTPDGARVVVLDAETGARIAELPTGAGTPLGSPLYLTGAPGGSLVAAVGDRIVVFDAAEPSAVLWNWPTGNAPAQLAGRVTWGPPAPGRPATLVVPTATGTLVLDAATGRQLLRLEATGNPLLTADQFLAATPNALASLMPVEEAERLCRARLKSDQSPGVALSLLQLARQSKRSPMAAEAAAEAARRLEASGDAQARQEFLDLLLAVDAAGFVTGEDARTIERLLGAAATAAGRPQRGALAKADRLVRQSQGEAAARLLAQLVLDSRESQLMAVNGTVASLDAHALSRLRRVAASDSAAAAAAQNLALSAAESAPPGPEQVVVLRNAVRVASATNGQNAVQRILARLAGVNASLAARLALESDSRAERSVPQILGGASRVVEFPGRLCMLAPRTVVPPHDRVLTMQGGDLVLRRPPEFAPEWKATIGAPDPEVISIGEQIVLWDERAPGYGEAIAVASKSGAVQWRTTRTSTLFGRLAPGGDESDQEITLPDGHAAPLAQVLPAVCGTTLVLARRDGRIMALDAADGRASRWQRPGGDLGIVDWASDPATVVMAAIDRGENASTLPKVLALDAATGASVLEFSISSGVSPELRWMRLLPGGMLIVASGAGIEARRLAGGDDQAPYWQVESSDVQYSVGAWVAGRWLLVQNRTEDLVAIELLTGRVEPAAFVPSDGPQGSIRGVEIGAGWVAVVRESHVDFFDPDGGYLGRDVPPDNRSISFAFASRDQLIAVDNSPDALPDRGPQQFGVELIRLDARAGGKAIGTPVALRTIGQGISDAKALDGWILLSNGAFVQAVDFRDGAPGTR